MHVPITAFYAGLTVILAFILSARVGWYRTKAGVSILHDGNMEVAERMRVHGNFSETVAFVLVLLALLEINGAPATFLHVLGIAYLLSRIAHAMGLKHDNIRHPLRAVGAMGTMFVMLVAGIYGMWQAYTHLF